MKRIRITITVDEKLLGLLDKQVDGAKIRNRSHAIEYVLLEALRPKIKKVIVLVGGEGMKMRPFTYEMPKPLLPVHNRPILEYTIELLRKHGLREVILSIGHLGEKIINHFGDGSKFGVKISYVNQGENLKGTGGAVKIAKHLLDKNPFLVVYGDTLTKIDLDEFIEFHQSQRKIATLALTSIKDPSFWGVVSLRGNEILGFSEKPRQRIPSHLINAGIYIFEPDIFDWFPKKKKFSLEEDVFPKLIQKRQLGGWVFEGQWFDIGTPETFERTIKEWKEG